jgi:hypothetical protein
MIFVQNCLPCRVHGRIHAISHFDIFRPRARHNSWRRSMSSAAGSAAPSAHAGADGVSRRDIAALVYNYLRSNGFAKVRPCPPRRRRRASPPARPFECPFESKKARGILPPTSLPTPPHPRLSLTLPSSSTRRRRSSSERTRTPCWRPSATACPPASSAWNASWASTSPSARGTTHGDSPWTQTRSRGACTSSSTTTPCTEDRAASAAAVPRCAPGRA